jgi:hypothetical protein
MSITGEERRVLITELMAYGESVLEAHRDLCKSDIEEQLDAHFESQYPEVNGTLIADVVEQIIAENFDPTPYCYGGHRGPLDCDCGPIAE